MKPKNGCDIHICITILGNHKLAYITLPSKNDSESKCLWFDRKVSRGFDWLVRRKDELECSAAQMSSTRWITSTGIRAVELRWVFLLVQPLHGEPNHLFVHFKLEFGFTIWEAQRLRQLVPNVWWLSDHCTFSSFLCFFNNKNRGVSYILMYENCDS